MVAYPPVSSIFSHPARNLFQARRVALHPAGQGGADPTPAVRRVDRGVAAPRGPDLGIADQSAPLVEGIEELSHVILKITGYIMGLAPLAVFASMAAIITTQGLGILVTYGKFVIEFYFALAVLWGITKK